MYEYTIESLKRRNADLVHKISSMEESIKSYSTMAKNCEKERDKFFEEMDQNNKVIEMLMKEG